MKRVSIAVVGFAAAAAFGWGWLNHWGDRSPAISVHEPHDRPQGLIVFWTGDAGFLGLPTGLARAWAARGHRVVLIDSLRYFTQQRSPAEQADDIAMIVTRHGQGLPVVLGGYSFGANTLVSAYPDLAPALRERVVAIVLVSLTATIDFEGAHVSLARSWLGLKGKGSRQVADAIAKLPADRTVCVIGLEDDRNPCASGAEGGLAHVVVPGGHRPGVSDSELADLLEPFVRGQKTHFKRPDNPPETMRLTSSSTRPAARPPGQAT